MTKQKITQQQFREEIERFVADGELTYIEALMQFAENHDLEVQTVAQMLSRNQELKRKVAEQCGGLKLLK